MQRRPQGERSGDGGAERWAAGDREERRLLALLRAGDETGGGWMRPPRPFDGPHALVAGRQTRTAIDRLSPAQRTVILLRDVHGASAEEVCVRAALERHLEAAGAG